MLKENVPEEALYCKASSYYIARNMIMNDIFVTAANKYKKLLNIQYNLVVGCKTKEYHIQIKFDESEFHHLAGLQYLKDIFYIRRTSRSEIFKKICTGQIDSEFLSQSSEYNKILDRINVVADLENFLDNSEIICKFNKSINPQSSITADYILKGTANNTSTYFFIQKNINGKYFGKSIFPQLNEKFDYSRGHTKCVLLCKEKVNLITNEKEILYTRPTYEKQLSSQLQQQKNDNVVQVKFDSPLTSHNTRIRIDGDTAEFEGNKADSSNPNGFKDVLKKIKSKLSEIFKPKDETSPQIMTAQTVDISSTSDETVAEAEIITNTKPVSKEFAVLIESREAFAEGSITQEEYRQAVKDFMHTLQGEEMWIEAADTLRSQIGNCPEEMKKYIGYELKNLEINIDKKFAPKRQQTFDELSKAAKENYIKLQKEKETVGIVSSHSDKNRNER